MEQNEKFIGHTEITPAPDLSFTKEDKREILPHDDDPMVIQVQILNCDVKYPTGKRRHHYACQHYAYTMDTCSESGERVKRSEFNDLANRREQIHNKK
jgi:hypothetical protein